MLNLFKSKVKRLIEKKDYEGLNQLLAIKPNLANEGITIPFEFKCNTKAHPLHRLCDAVFVNKITDDEAVSLAKIFLKNGANIDGDKVKNEGTPLLAAASLHAEQVGIFYIENGADIHYTFKNDGASALHWAAFCGREKLVGHLIGSNAKIDEPDKIYQSTPMGWAIQTLLTNDFGNKHNQLECIKMLLLAGANIEKLDRDKVDCLNNLSKKDIALKNLLI